MITLTNLKRTVHHLVVYDTVKDHEDRDVTVRRALVPIGDSADLELDDPDDPDAEPIRNEFTVPEHWIEVEWMPRTDHQRYTPAPVVHFSDEQYKALGKANERKIDDLVARGELRRDVVKRKVPPAHKAAREAGLKVTRVPAPEFDDPMFSWDSLKQGRVERQPAHNDVVHADDADTNSED